MELNGVYQEPSPLDALWTLYQQQSAQVRRSFLVRARQADKELDVPGMLTREEMIKASVERMRDIVDGREQTLAHADVMRMVDEAIRVSFSANSSHGSTASSMPSTTRRYTSSASRNENQTNQSINKQ